MLPGKKLPIYGRVRDEWQAGDHQIEVSVERQVAERILVEARRFVESMEKAGFGLYKNIVAEGVPLPLPASLPA